MTNFNKFFLIIMISATFGISACSNTFDGAGRDISNAGGWIQDKF